jgi:protease IV
MLQFLKYVLATIVGLFFFLMLSFFLMIGIAAAFSSSKDDKPTIAENTVLKLDLNQVITEQTPEDDPFTKAFGGNNDMQTSIIEIKEALANAKLDPNIKGIYLKTEYPQASFATLEEVRNALIDFKSSKKFIYTYAETMSQKGYYLASVADKSYVNPAGGMEYKGLSGEYMFYKGMFDKLEIKPEIFRVGKFKSAVEPYFRTNMSDESKEQTKSLLNSVSGFVFNNIAKSRNLTVADLDKIANEGLIQEPEDGVKYKLITNVGYYDEFESAIRSQLKMKKDAKIEYIGLSKYSKAEKFVKEGNRDNRIAVIIGQFILAKAMRNLLVQNVS